MATAKRGRRAHQPGMKGAPQRIDHHRVLVSRAQGLCGRDRDGGGSERGERLSNPGEAEKVNPGGSGAAAVVWIHSRGEKSGR